MTASLRHRLALLVSVVAAMLVAMDGTVLLVAQPSLGRSLGAGVAEVQWTSTGYLVAVAALLVISGRLGDRYGHQRLLFVGVLGFGAASAGIALAPSVGWVIGLRAVQGGFGALLQPASLALLRLAAPAERLGRLVAVRTSAIGVAAGVGPLLGGVLVAHLGWRSVFWLNTPVAVLIAVLTLAAVRPSATERAGGAGSRRLDLGGAALLATALAVLVDALAGIPSHGWTGARTLLGLLAATGLTAVLVRHERRAADPIVPRAVTRSAPVTASMAILLFTGAGMYGALFTATFYLQDVLRLDPLATGLRVLPLTVFMVLGAPVAGAALGRLGPRRTAVIGSALVVLGIGGLSQLGPVEAVAAAGASFAALGAGFAFVMVTATGTVIGDAPAGYAGVVGGLKQTAMNIGPTLGIAVAASARTASAHAASAGAPAMGHALPALAVVAALGLPSTALLPPRPTRPRTRPEAGPAAQSEARPEAQPDQVRARAGG